MNDSELLQRYSENGSEEAFAEVVKRHVDLVFSAALRQVGGDRSLAEEVAQMVFTDLARKAGELSRREVLSGWLYTSTRFAASTRIRGEKRRRAREQEAFAMQQTLGQPESHPDWDQLKTVLDETMHELKEPDRDAVLLRFFNGCQFAEVGEKLGVSEDGARMRVARALEKLRALLKGKGIPSSCATLAAVLAQHSVGAAPAGLAASIAQTATTAVLASGTVAVSASMGAGAASGGGGTTAGFLEFMGMTKLKTTAIVALMAGVAVPTALQHQSNKDLRVRNDLLARENGEFTDRLAPVLAENARLSNLVALAEPGANPDRSNELLRLRAEVTRLRQEARNSPTPGIAANAQDPINATLQTLGARVVSLKAKLEQMPQTKIPELEYLDEKAWLDAVAPLEKLETDEEYRQGLNMLRSRAKAEAGRKLQTAVQKYAEANSGMLPANLEQVQGYLEKPMDPAILERYQMVGTGKLNDLQRDQSVFEEIAPPVDDEYDTYFRFMRNGSSSTSFSQVGFSLENAATAYANANEGRLPREINQISPYLKEPVSPDRVQKFLQKIPPNVSTLAEYKAHQN